MFGKHEQKAYQEYDKRDQSPTVLLQMISEYCLNNGLMINSSTKRQASFFTVLCAALCAYTITIGVSLSAHN